MSYEQFKRKIQPLINIYHLFKAFFASVFYSFPSKNLKVIGVTGTDGKTTTTLLIYHILKSLGKRVSMVSSIYAKIGKEEFSTGLHVTTPDAVYTQKLLSLAAKQKEEYFVLETTSHALDQNRVWGVNFEVGAVTNITPEHLDYHKTYENYVEAKSRLLLASKKVLLNRDDQSFEFLMKIFDSNRGFYTYSLKSKADFNLNLEKKLDKHLAEFNNYNYLAAYSVAKLLNFPDSKIIQALKTFKLPKGRLEVVHDGEFKVIIDFAHTSNSFKEVLKEVRGQIKQNGKLIHVFGAAGLRDNLKRPLMGETSGLFSDVVILTEEDYRTENPQEITNQIAKGLEKRGFRLTAENKHGGAKSYSVILDRNRAIKKAIEIAGVNDIVILTGKSHEQSLARGKKEYPWDEQQAVFDALKQKK